MHERQTQVRAGPTSAGGRLRDTDGMLGSLNRVLEGFGVVGGEHRLQQLVCVLSPGLSLQVYCHDVSHSLYGFALSVSDTAASLSLRREKYHKALSRGVSQAHSTGTEEEEG
ncbi:unnamed protein product [Arctogadus glacialis]